jgi:hypothetical protein
LSGKIHHPMRIVIPIIIYVIVPVLGCLTYLKIDRDMQRKEIQFAPDIPIFALFFGYGGWLVFILTAFFWEMSGMAALGFFVLLIPTPFVILGCAVWLYRHRGESRYYGYSLRASYIYVSLTVLVWAGLFLNSGRR